MQSVGGDPRPLVLAILAVSLALEPLEHWNIGPVLPVPSATLKKKEQMHNTWVRLA